MIRRGGAISSVLSLLCLQYTDFTLHILNFWCIEYFYCWISAICAMPCKKTVQHDPLTYWHYRLSAWCRQWVYEGILISQQVTAVVSIDNYFLQHIDVLADHDRKYFDISCLMFCSRCPPVPSHYWKWGTRAPMPHGVGASAHGTHGSHGNSRGIIHASTYNGTINTV